MPANLKWQEADLTIQHPRSQWAAWGVTRADGRAADRTALKASLVLPMGRFGPAFLAYDNFQVYLKWNESLMYSLTAAYYATRLDGAPAMQRGAPNIPKLTFDENRELQQILQKRGYDVGRIDGVLGLKSRTAVRDVQIKLGLPANSWPTAELLQRLRELAQRTIGLAGGKRHDRAQPLYRTRIDASARLGRTGRIQVASSAPLGRRSQNLSEPRDPGRRAVPARRAGRPDRALRRTEDERGLRASRS